MAATPRTSRIASTRLNRFTSPPLERGLVTFAGADPNRGFDRKDEDLAVTDVAGLRRAGHRVGHLVGQVIGDHDLDLDLRQEVHRVLAAAVQFGVALLAAKSTDLGYRHAHDADAGERFLDVVELERLDDRLDLFHRWSSGSPRSNAAAACLFQRVLSSAFKIDARSISSSEPDGTSEGAMVGAAPPSAGRCWSASGRSAGVISRPRETSTARSIACCSSRTLPGQEWARRRRYASGAIASIGRACLAV